LLLDLFAKSLEIGFDLASKLRLGALPSGFAFEDIDFTGWPMPTNGWRRERADCAPGGRFPD
jgi:hypothetical protein